MMKQAILVSILLQAGYQYTEFTLQIIENKSDLNFDRAYYKNLGKEKQLPALTDILKKSKQHVVVDKKVGSDGLALVMSDSKGHHATIFIHGQAQYSIEYKRKKTQKIAQFPDITPIGTGPYSAQVMMQDDVDKKLIAQPYAHNYQEPAAFNLIITGNQGSYQLYLQPTTK